MIINCVAYQKGLKYKDLKLEELTETLKTPEIVVWLALFEPTKEELNQISAIFNLHPLAIEDINHDMQRVKLEEYGDNLFVVVKAPELKNNKIHLGDIYFIVGPQFVVSIRKYTTIGFSQIRERCESEPHLLSMGSGFIFYTLLDNVVDRYFPIIEQFEQDLEKLEDSIFKSSDAQKNN